MVERKKATHLGLSSLGSGDQVLVEDFEDVVADVRELGLDLLAVRLDLLHLALVPLALFLLLDRADDPPRSPTRANHVLVRDGEEVALLDGELETELQVRASR